MDWLWQLFAHVCGQVHCWRVGSVLLPLCERCLGLYAGSACALGIFAWFRPRPTTAVLWFHGLMLLAMAPFGYHIVPHGPDLRTITGLLFGFGLTYYLALNPALRLGLFQRQRGALREYALTLLAVVAVVMIAVRYGGPWAAWLLALSGLAGTLALLVLVVANIILLPSTLWARTAAGCPVQSHSSHP